MKNVQPVIVTGRKLSDFAACGREVPPDFTVRKCVLCQVDVAISPEGAARLVGTEYPSGAICTPCALLLLPKLQDPEFAITKSAAEQAQRSDGARRNFDLLLSKLRGEQ